MRRKDVDELCEVVLRCGIATLTQRMAISQRMIDWFEAAKVNAALAKKREAKS